MSKDSYKIDMCNGPVLPKVIAFSLPLMLSSCLQLLFNAADVIVVGRFAGSPSLAAVGSTTTIINLLTNLFIGFSIGANVNVARTIGNQDEQGTQDNVHTAVSVSLISGIALVIIGVLTARPFLTWMGTPDDVIGKATLYLTIIFIGMPSNMAYNFGSSILRAMGDTKRPLYFLSAAGVLNIILNLIFVILFRMDVAGVALATILSETLSAVLILGCLCKTKGSCHLNIRKLYIHPTQLKRMLRIGLPAGIQAALFSFSNVLIQSSINSFGSVVMAGSSAAASIENFVYISMNAVHQAMVSFVSQNNGAGKAERINKILFSCLFLVTSSASSWVAESISCLCLSCPSIPLTRLLLPRGRQGYSGSAPRIFFAESWKSSWASCEVSAMPSLLCWWLSPVPACSGSSGFRLYLPGIRPRKYCIFPMPPPGF